MTGLAELITGQPSRRSHPVPESVPLPAGIPVRRSGRARIHRDVHRRTAAAIMGLAEGDDEDDDDSIIPAEAEEIGSTGVPQTGADEDSEAAVEADGVHPDIGPDSERLMTPRSALVAPDLTPRAHEPIDASEVPAPRVQPSQPSTPAQNTRNTVDPLAVILGRTGSKPPETAKVVTAEAASQDAANATISALLNTGPGGETLLRRGQPMPDHVPGSSASVMETFSKYGPSRSK